MASDVQVVCVQRHIVSTLKGNRDLFRAKLRVVHKPATTWTITFSLLQLANVCVSARLKLDAKELQAVLQRKPEKVSSWLWRGMTLAVAAALLIVVTTSHAASSALLDVVTSTVGVALGVTVACAVTVAYLLRRVLLPVRSFLEHRDAAPAVRRMLDTLLSSPSLLTDARVCAFLALSRHRLSRTADSPLQEGLVRYRRHTRNEWFRSWRQAQLLCCECACRFRWWGAPGWTTAWAVLYLHGLELYSSPTAVEPSEVLLLSTGANVRTERRRLLVVGTNWMAEVRCASAEELLSWSATMHTATSLARNPYVRDHPYGSFSPVRSAPHTHARALVDGDAYFAAVAAAIDAATTSVFIAGWWVSPDVHLGRPPAVDGSTTLRALLRAKADAGVRVYVLLYREVESVLPNASKYTSVQLQHPNILVLRHRSRFGANMSFSHHEKLVVVDETTAFVGGLDLALMRYDTPAHVLRDDQGAPTWPGKDYCNPRVRDFEAVHEPHTDLMDRTRFPRMPWHDVAVQLHGGAAFDVARHFVGRWDHARAARNTAKPRGFRVPSISLATGAAAAAAGDGAAATGPGSGGASRKGGRLATAATTTSGAGVTDDLDDDSLSMSPWAPSGMESPAVAAGGVANVESEPLALPAPLGSPDTAVPVSAQVVRSVGRWSAAARRETSVASAMVALVKQARRFVYIENQFFVSGQPEDTLIGNRVVAALAQRIGRAHVEGKPFRCVVVLPLLPGFPGDIAPASSSALSTVAFLQRRTINSLFAALRTHGVSGPHRYVRFFGLRTAQQLRPPTGPWVTEQVYVHSKLMVVDDVTAVVGSANLNDRSLLGGRDSEVAVVLRDSELQPSQLCGRPIAVGRMCHGLRMSLMAEHLGLDADGMRQYVDPGTDVAWAALADHADRNTAALETAFGCLPSDLVHSWQELRGRRHVLASMLRGGGHGSGSGSGSGRGQAAAGAVSGSVGRQDPELLSAANAGRVEAAPSAAGDGHRPPGGSGVGSASHRPTGRLCAAAVDARLPPTSDTTKPASCVRPVALDHMRGHLVTFPLAFLKDEDLAPPSLSVSGMVPDVFT